MKIENTSLKSIFIIASLIIFNDYMEKIGHVTLLPLRSEKTSLRFRDIRLSIQKKNALKKMLKPLGKIYKTSISSIASCPVGQGHDFLQDSPIDTLPLLGICQ